MIRKYQEWIKESEKMEAAETPAAPAAPAVPEMPADPSMALPGAEDTSAPAEGAPETPVEETPESDMEQFNTLDTARRDAIKAFKEKQKEFLEIPEEIRKNPTEEADKTKVEGLKTELTELNKTMKDAFDAWDKFNSETLGIEAEGEEVEP